MFKTGSPAAVAVVTFDFSGSSSRLGWGSSVRLRSSSSPPYLAKGQYGRGGSLSSSEVCACSSGSAQGRYSPHPSRAQVYVGFAQFPFLLGHGCRRAARASRPAHISYSSLPVFPSFWGMLGCPVACAPKACPLSPKESPLRLSAPLLAVPVSGAAAVPSLLPLPLCSCCLVLPETTFPSDLQVEQEMTSQLCIRYSSFPKCLVFIPPNRQAGMCVKLARRIAFQIRNAKEGKKTKVQFFKYNGSQVELCCSARLEIVADCC